MIDRGKRSVIGVRVDAVDYEAAVDRVIRAAEARRPYGVSALAVHGVMSGVLAPEQRHRLNSLDLLTPDGQPVRWSLNALHGCRLPDRVYGPVLMSRIIAAAEQRGIPVYFYGSSAGVLDRLIAAMRRRHPGVKIAGAECSRFRALSEPERDQLVDRVARSGADILFVGLGCPRQEVFVYELAERIGIPAVAVGAAFDYHAGELTEPPRLVQTAGLQWLHRLIGDPRRLWRRYLLLNPAFVVLLFLQASRIWQPDERGKTPLAELRPG
jgi:exopolysaccharide biosynthesis WecB/TagA/CpsF family protein